MAEALNTKRKLCIVKNNGPLPELGGIAGPILGPCQISMRAIINMVHNGRNVYEVNPKKMSEMVKLTIQNVQKNNFPDPERFIMPEEKKEPVKPVVASKSEVIVATQENLRVTEQEDPLNTIINHTSQETEPTDKTNTAKISVSDQNSIKHEYDGKKGKNRDNDFKKR